MIGLLCRWDLVIDCLAKPKTPDSRENKPAQLTAVAHYHGRKCSTQQHALLQETDHLPNIVKKKLQTGAVVLSLGPDGFFPRPSFIDHMTLNRAPMDVVGGVFGIITTFMREFSGETTAVAVQAQSCGVRAAGDGKAPNGELNALVRVFRKATWAIGIKFPTYKTFKDEKECAIDARKIKTYTEKKDEKTGSQRESTKTTTTGSTKTNLLNNTETTQTTEDKRRYNSTQTTTTTKDGSVHKVTETSQLKNGAKGKIVTETKTDGKRSEKDKKLRGKRAIDQLKGKLYDKTDFDLVIMIDDKEIPILESAREILELKEKILGIRKSITNITEFFKKLPQLGWKFSLDIQVLSGMVGVSCEPEYLEGIRADGRYRGVNHVFAIHINILICKIAGSLSFGVALKSKSLRTGLEIAVKGTITFEASIDTDVFLNTSKETDLVIRAKVESSIKLAVVAYVELVGFTIGDAELSISTGIEFDARLCIDVNKPTFALKGKIKTKPIVLKGYIRGIFWDSKMEPKTLVEEHELYSFG